MEFDRRVQIRIRKPGTDKRGFGSGYLIAPRLVLTAAHVLDGLDAAAQDAVTVTQPDTGEQEHAACVRWQRTDETVDAALIEITDGHRWQTPESLADLLTRPPQRYGLIIGTRRHPVTATGFPRMQKDADDGRRLDEQVTGHIAPGTGALAGRYEITSTDPTPGVSGDDRWKGMSGAVTLADDGFGGDLLCGVVRRDRRADDGTRLTATAAANLLADDAFRTLTTEHTGWEPVLEPIEPAALLTPATADRNFRSPAALLRADTEAVTFHGRDTELADLRAWCENGPPSISLRVMTGPGGQGKTRLARRLTDTMSWHGWVTGHLRSDLTDDPALDGTPPDFTTLSTALPLLLVVDYAETRPRLLRRLITHLHRSRHRVRLLLLARSDGEWRTGSLQAVPAVRDLLEEAPLTPLAPLIPTSQPLQDRQSAYHRAAADLAHLLPPVPTLPAYDWNVLAADLRPPADLHDHRYDNVLTLQMTALVDLLQHGPRPVDATPGTPLERILLKHEDRFWEASAKTPAYKLDLSNENLGAAVAVAALCGAGTRNEAVQAISTLPGLPDHQAATAADWLASLYPGGPDQYWGSLQPDRVAEYHASQVLGEHDNLLRPLLEVGTPAQRARTVIVLARAAIAHFNADRTADSERVLHTLDAALDDTPFGYQAVEAVSAALPSPSRIIAPLALRFTNALASMYRQMVQDDHDGYELDLARSLTNLGIRWAELGRWDEALTMTKDAVEIRRRLAAEDPAANEPSLAGSLSNLAHYLGIAGRLSEALDASNEAVEAYHRLAAEDPAAHQPGLALSLNNHSNHLATAGRLSEALDATLESVEIYRRLAAGDRAAHEPGYAGALSNFGSRLADAGLWAEALAVTEEAVGIYQGLAAEDRAAHEPGYAGALSNLAGLLGEVGRRDEAVTAYQQAVEIRRRLAAENPAAYEPDLAVLLSNLAIQLTVAGSRGEALVSVEGAVEIQRRLAAENPGHEPGLARSLSILAQLLWLEEDLSKALSVTGEAVHLYTSHIAINPSILKQLHEVLALQARLLEGIGREKEAEHVRRWLGEHPPPDSHK